MSRVGADPRIFELDARDVARYDDTTRAIGRRVRIAGRKLSAVRLSGDLCGEGWLRECSPKRDVVGGAMLLFPSARPPGGRALRGRIVCNCFDVSEAEIESVRAALPCVGARALDAVQATRKCGTNCGSCPPELRRMFVPHRDSAELAAP